MATTNLGKVSVTPRGEYDPLITYERLDVISHNGSSYIVKQASTGVTPIEGEFYALIAEKGDGGSFVKKAYKTYAAMDADKVNIPTNSSVDVTNDPDESKNGAYIYDGVAFTRSQYDSKVVTDKIIADTAIAVQDAINNTVVSSGFVTIDSFELGATITQRNEALRHVADGKLYRWAGDLPKVVPASSTPTSSGGMGDNAWLEVSDVTFRQEITNPAIGAAMVARGVVAVDSIADLLTLPAGQRKADIRYLVKEYHAGTGFGGGDFVWDATSTSTVNNGTVFAVTGVVTGRWLRIMDGGDWWVEWFGTKKDGTTDDSGAIRTAVESAPNGGTLRFGVGDFLALTPVRVAKLLNLYGSGMGTKMYIRDRMFIFGQPASGEIPRFNAQPIIKDFFFTSPSGGMQGNVATYFGNSTPNVGYQTKTTTYAGFKKSSTENATNIAIVFEQIYAPCKISGCYFYEIGTGIKVGLNYGHIVENNRFLWCTVGIDVAGISTTVNIVTNTIERCAIGLYIHWPCHHIFVDKNVIEANYAGCDILCWQGPQSLTITRNYMEASPECIVFAGGTEGYPASKVLIEGNFSIRLKFRGVAKNFKVIRNNLQNVDFALKVGDTLSNIIFEDNYFNSDEEPFNPIYADTGGGNFTGVRWNSVSERFKETVKFISPTRFIGAALLGATTDDMNTFIKTEANLIRNTASSISKTFEVVVPNESFNAILEVLSVKSTVNGTKSSRIVKHTVMIRRIKGQDTVTTVKLDSDVDIPSADELTISEANLTPSSQITGASTEGQRVSIFTLNGDGATTASWLIGVEMLCNRTDVLIIRGT